MSDMMLRVEGADEINELLKQLPRKALFGVSIGMNRTMDEAQDAIRKRVANKFTLRRKTFMEQTIYRRPGLWPNGDFANKDNPHSAAVRINPNRDFLAKFEEGGSKRPRGGGVGGAGDKDRALAVPVLGGARTSKGAVVPTKYTLKALFFKQQSKASQAASVYGQRKGVRKTLLKRSVAQDVAVINGKVFQIQGTKNKPKLKLLWVFKKSTWIDRRLDFVKTGRQVIDRRAEANVSGAITIEMTRGLDAVNRRTNPANSVR